MESLNGDVLGVHLADVDDDPLAAGQAVPVDQYQGGTVRGNDLVVRWVDHKDSPQQSGLGDAAEFRPFFEPLAP